MSEYSPKRRTALVFTGSGTTGAYHAGALRALDESGVKIDMVVGSGIGALSAACAAVQGGAKLYGPGGFWSDVSPGAFYRLRPMARAAVGLLGLAFGVFAAPVLLGLALGLAFPLLLIADRLLPGTTGRVLGWLLPAPSTLSGPYLAALAIPVFLLALAGTAALAWLLLRDRRRFPEAFESLFDARPGILRLRRLLAEVAGGAALRGAVPSEAELGRRYVALLSENLGEPGFRELVLRTADLDRAGPLSFRFLREGTAAGERPREGGVPAGVELRSPGQDALLFDALATSVLCPFGLPPRRVSFPKGAVHAGETHRLTDATLVGGAGVAEAVAAGAEQVIAVCGVPAEASPPGRRRGALARVDASLRVLERQAAREIDDVERESRMAATLGHRTADVQGAWQDPASGRLVREVDLWVIRPERRAIGPLELDGTLDPATEVRQGVEDLLEMGFKDAYRLFVEPVVGQAPLPEREEGKYRDTQPVGL